MVSKLNVFPASIGAALLAKRLPIWAALLIVGVFIVVIDALIARSALAKLSVQNIKPDRTIANVGEDARIIKEHV